MSKKVLVIKSTVNIDWKEENKYVEAVGKSLHDWGVVYLPYYVNYEFGEIDGVIWDGSEKKEEKKSEVDWDAIFTELEKLERDAYIDYDNYKSGWNDALEHAKRVMEQYKEKKGA